MRRFKTYFCTKCNRIHSLDTQIGKKHYEFNQKNQDQLELEMNI